MHVVSWRTGVTKSLTQCWQQGTQIAELTVERDELRNGLELLSKHFRDAEPEFGAVGDDLGWDPVQTARYAMLEMRDEINSLEEAVRIAREDRDKEESDAQEAVQAALDKLRSLRSHVITGDGRKGE